MFLVPCALASQPVFSLLSNAQPRLQALQTSNGDPWEILTDYPFRWNFHTDLSVVIYPRVCVCVCVCVRACTFAPPGYGNYRHYIYTHTHIYIYPCRWEYLPVATQHRHRGPLHCYITTISCAEARHRSPDYIELYSKALLA